MGDLGLDTTGKKQILMDRLKEYENSIAKIETMAIKDYVFGKNFGKRVLNLGQKVEKMLEDPNTPKETKEKGFAANFHEEWLKQHPESSLSKSKLNYHYLKLQIQKEETKPDKQELPIKPQR